ncbi:MAG: hypothetical protein JWQ42_1575 [Edaphobacter sp.]|nr:hypothetical protein [Edaphobacter sp.]
MAVMVMTGVSTLPCVALAEVAGKWVAEISSLVLLSRFMHVYRSSAGATL